MSIVEVGSVDDFMRAINAKETLEIRLMEKIYDFGESFVVMDRSNKYVTGQYASGPVEFRRGSFQIKRAENIRMDHIAIRTGDWGTPMEAGNNDALQVIDGAKTIVLDHMEFTWGVDETFSVWEAFDVVLTHCIIGEGLLSQRHIKRGHVRGKGLLVGGNHANNVRMYFNWLHNNPDRNPLMNGGKRSVFHNNVVYNPGWAGYTVYPYYSEATAQCTDNFFVAGPNTQMYGPIRLMGDAPRGKDSRVYLGGNTMLRYEEGVPLTRGHIERMPALEDENDVYTIDHILANAGVTKPGMTSTKMRYMDEFNNGRGQHIQHEDEVGGHIEFVHDTRPPVPIVVKTDGHSKATPVGIGYPRLVQGDVPGEDPQTLEPGQQVEIDGRIYEIQVEYSLKEVELGGD